VFFCIDVLGSNKGSIGVIHFSPVGWLGIAVLMEIPMAMIVLSLILKPAANRWANIVAGIIETAAVLLTSFIFPIFHITKSLDPIDKCAGAEHREKESVCRRGTCDRGICTKPLSRRTRGSYGFCNGDS
jgi:Family of unknown function (DUF6326)